MLLLSLNFCAKKSGLHGRHHADRYLKSLSYLKEDPSFDMTMTQAIRDLFVWHRPHKLLTSIRVLCISLSAEVPSENLLPPKSTTKCEWLSNYMIGRMLFKAECIYTKGQKYNRTQMSWPGRPGQDV